MTIEEWIKYKIPLNEVIINCSIKNGSDAMLRFPIGVSISCKMEYVDKLNDTIRNNVKSINSKLYSLSINTTTDRKRRGDWGGGNKPIRRATILKSLNDNSFKQTSSGHTFFEDITKSKFVFSPEGNGIDTHRTYEALLFKAIPICEHNDDIKKKYEGLPIIYTTDYKEITEDFLYEKYMELKGKIFDFSKLFLSYYDENTQNEIIDNGNHWVGKFKQAFGAAYAYPLDLSCFPSTKNIYNDLTFFTVTNSGYMNMTLNCIESLKKLRINIKFKVHCLDKECYEKLKEKHDQVYLHEDLIKEESIFSDKNWSFLTMKKLDIMYKELETSKYVLFTDGDIVFENPYFIIDPYRKMLENDLELYVQDEHPINGICSGFYIIKSNDNVKNLFSKDSLIKHLGENKNDQDFINKLIQGNKIKSKRMPKEQYSNGRYYYDVLSKKNYKDYENYIIHFNWLKGGESKRNKMVQYKKWYMGDLKHK